MAMTEPRVHELRLAARRCGSILKVLDSLKDGTAVWRRAEKRSRTLLSALGPLRDAQLLRIRLLNEEMPNASRKHLLLLAQAEVHKLRGPARSALKASPELPLQSLSEVFKSMSGHGAPQLAGAIDTCLDRSLQKLVAAWQGLDLSDAESLHRARVSLKKHRLLLVSLAPALRLAGVEEFRAMKALQNALGDYNDERLYLAWLRAHGQGRSPAARRAAARLASQHRAVRSATATKRSPTLALIIQRSSGHQGASTKAKAQALNTL